MPKRPLPFCANCGYHAGWHKADSNNCPVQVPGPALPSSQRGPRRSIRYSPTLTFQPVNTDSPEAKPSAKPAATPPPRPQSLQGWNRQATEALSVLSKTTRDTADAARVLNALTALTDENCPELLSMNRAVSKEDLLRLSAELAHALYRAQSTIGTTRLILAEALSLPGMKVSK